MDISKFGRLFSAAPCHEVAFVVHGGVDFVCGGRIIRVGKINPT
jgi:hypothetical protein